MYALRVIFWHITDFYDLVAEAETVLRSTDRIRLADGHKSLPTRFQHNMNGG